MIEIDKPPLEAVYFTHAGVKGMKWGRRKAKPPGNIRKGISKSSAAKKVGIGLAAVAVTIAAGRVAPLSAPVTLALGAATVGALLAREGRRPVRPAGS